MDQPNLVAMTNDQLLALVQQLQQMLDRHNASDHHAVHSRRIQWGLARGCRCQFRPRDHHGRRIGSRLPQLRRRSKLGLRNPLDIR